MADASAVVAAKPPATWAHRAYTTARTSVLAVLCNVVALCVFSYMYGTPVVSVGGATLHGITRVQHAVAVDDLVAMFFVLIAGGTGALLMHDLILKVRDAAVALVVLALCAGATVLYHQSHSAVVTAPPPPPPRAPEETVKSITDAAMMWWRTRAA